jgi:hypothetical protein
MADVKTNRGAIKGSAQLTRHLYRWNLKVRLTEMIWTGTFSIKEHRYISMEKSFVSTVEFLMSNSPM